MAIGPGYRTFTFDGQNSGSYDVGISGQAVYNAPEREVEMITIPGRNGAFPQDNGRFENIEVTYPAAIFGDTQAEFAQKLSDLRNMLASRTGYCRLSDDYNPDEYRLAIYKSGLEVDPVSFQRAGEFNIIFECKPQRFLKSGETLTAITSPTALTNPSPFRSSPLMKVKGYGQIITGLYNPPITRLYNLPVGEIVLRSAWDYREFDFNQNAGHTFYDSFDRIEGLMNSADAMRQGGVKFDIELSYPQNLGRISSVNIGSYTGCSVYKVMGNVPLLSINLDASNFVYGTAATKTGSVTCSIITSGGTYSKTFTVSIAYDGGNIFNYAVSVSDVSGDVHYRVSAMAQPWRGDSSKSVTDYQYIDFETGEAYFIYTNVDEFKVSRNNAIEFPTELPTLGSDARVEYDNTFTEFYVAPRWWMV